MLLRLHVNFHFYPFTQPSPSPHVISSIFFQISLFESVKNHVAHPYILVIFCIIIIAADSLSYTIISDIITWLTSKLWAA